METKTQQFVNQIFFPVMEFLRTLAVDNVLCNGKAIVNAFIQWKYIWPATATAVDVCKLKRRSRSNWSHKYDWLVNVECNCGIFVTVFFRFVFVLELKTKKDAQQTGDII